MKHKVLIVEDDEGLLAVMELMFANDFDVVTADDGQKAISLLESDSFHFVITDMHLPNKNGLEILEFAQSLSIENRPSVVLMSGDMDEKKIELAFSKGAADYIGKPFNVLAFHKRIFRMSKDIDNITLLRKKDEQKRSLAETAMKQSAAYGSGLELLARLNKCRDIEQLMKVLTQGLLSQGYHCAVEFRHQDKRFNFDADTDVCGENEKKVFEVLHDKGRIYNFGKRCIFNEPNASILVKNMPSEGTMSYDAAIDLFAKLVPALGSRFVALMNVDAMMQTRASLNETIAMVKHSVAQMEVERRQKIEDIAASIGVSFHQLDMTEEQESFFLDMIEKKLSTDNSNEKFSAVTQLLDECAARLDVQIDEQLSVQEEVEESDEVSDDDIELF